MPGQSIQTRSTTTTPSTEPSSSIYRPPGWLEGWQAFEPPPVSVAVINAALVEAERACEPSSPDYVARCIRKLWDALNPPKSDKVQGALADWWTRNEAVYVAALQDIPPDLLASGCRAALQTERFMPKPADVRKHVADDWAARSTARHRLTLARRRAMASGIPTSSSSPSDREPLSDADKAKIDAIKASLAGLSKRGNRPEAAE